MDAKRVVRETELQLAIMRMEDQFVCRRPRAPARLSSIATTKYMTIQVSSHDNLAFQSLEKDFKNYVPSKGVASMYIGTCAYPKVAQRK